MVVGLNDDESIRRLKGPERPILDQNSRGQLLASLKYVDYVVTFEDDTPLRLIAALRPTHIVKGGDYAAGDVVGGTYAPVSITPFQPGLSTSDIIRKIKGLP